MLHMEDSWQHAKAKTFRIHHQVIGQKSMGKDVSDEVVALSGNENKEILLSFLRLSASHIKKLKLEEKNVDVKKLETTGKSAIIPVSDSFEEKSEETKGEINSSDRRLAGEEKEDVLDYIIYVDIFSEGVDVPEINQVIMLRPTESPIIFIQPGDRSYNKDNIRLYVTGGGCVIFLGGSTIHFEENSRNKIFQAIDNANFSDIKLIRENYTN